MLLIHAHTRTQYVLIERDRTGCSSTVKRAKLQATLEGDVSSEEQESERACEAKASSCRLRAAVLPAKLARSSESDEQPVVRRFRRSSDAFREDPYGSQQLIASSPTLLAGVVTPNPWQRLPLSATAVRALGRS
jgi:hypothetical protein